MQNIGLPVVIKTAVQVVSGGWIFLNLKWRTEMMPASCSSDSEDLKF